MSKPELGVKRDCPECGIRFYDLNKEPAHCPKCQHAFTPEALLKPRKVRAPDAPVVEKDKEEKPQAETSLEDADKETKAAESKRKASLDDDNDDNDDDAAAEDGDKLDAELAELEDVDDADDDDEEADDNTTILDDSDAESDVAGMVVKKAETATKFLAR